MNEDLSTTLAHTIDLLTGCRLVPVVVIDDANRAVALAETLRDSGVATAEVTLRTPHAIDAIGAMASVTGFAVGAGTVLNTADAERAMEAGARYLVSPGFDEDSILHAHERGVPFVPGVATATEVQRAHAAGLTHLKIFPAGVLGGRALIDALVGPFPTMHFLPSGGVTLDNARDYLESPSVFAVSGSWMVPRAAIAAGDFATIGRLTREAADIVRAR